jgi:hypothetical protein
MAIREFQRLELRTELGTVIIPSILGLAHDSYKHERYKLAAAWRPGRFPAMNRHKLYVQRVISVLFSHKLHTGKHFLPMDRGTN